MIGEGYELLSLFMRYVFIGLGALILWRAFRWMRKDSRAYKRQMRALPDAGLVGEIVDLQSGKSQPLPREGMMGSSRDCDIRIKGPGVARRHALFAFEEGKGMKITPVRRSVIFLAGVELEGSAHALHGTQVQLGEAMLRVRLFAGLKVPHPAQFQMDLPEQDMEEADWNGDTMPAAFSQPFAPTEEYTPVYPPLQQYGSPELEYAPNSAEMPGENQPIFNTPAPDYQGNYTEDGQMTWQYAPYPVEELKRMQEMQQNQGNYFPDEEMGDDEAVPYQSPVVRRRRRSRQ